MKFDSSAAAAIVGCLAAVDDKDSFGAVAAVAVAAVGGGNVVEGLAAAAAVAGNEPEGLAVAYSEDVFETVVGTVDVAALEGQAVDAPRRGSRKLRCRESL